MKELFFQPIYSLKLLYKIVHYIFNNPKKWNEIGRINTEEGVKYFNSSAHDIVHFEFVENLMNLDDLKKDILLFEKSEEEVLKIADQNLQYWKRKDEIKLLKCDASKPWGCLTDGLDEFEEDLVLKAVKKNGPKGKNEKTREPNPR